MSTFKTSKEVQLINGGFVSDSSKNPIKNKDFNKAQRKAEWLVVLADKMKGKTFTDTKADDINLLISETDKELNGKKVTEFLAMPKAPTGTIASKMQKEAMEFIGFVEEKGQTEKVNEKLQEFNIINEFEEHGLFFGKGAEKLNKIYTMKEIIAAAKVVYAVI